MATTRRGFLFEMAAATAGAAALLVDPERLLWEPGKKTIIDLGARVQAPTFEQILSLTQFDLIGAGAGPFNKPIYMPNRYVLTLADGRAFGFDSNWQIKSGRGPGGTVLSGQEQAAFAAALERGRRRFSPG